MENLNEPKHDQMPSDKEESSSLSQETDNPVPAGPEGETTPEEKETEADAAAAEQHVESSGTEQPLAEAEGEAAGNETAGEHEEAELEEPEHEHEEHEEEEIDLTGLDKEGLLKIVQEAAEHPEGRNIGKRVQQAKTEFNRLVREERAEKLAHWKEEGKEENEFMYDHESLVHEFNTAVKSFKKKRQEHVAGLNQQKEENLKLKKDILEKLKELTEQSETGSSFTEFKKLQEEWRKIGHVPISDAENIWNTYNFYVDRFYEQRSLYSEFKELDRKRNLTAKEELVSKIEQLAQIEDIGEAMKLLKQYQEEWRHIGPVPKENLEPVIQRYKTAVINLYDRKEKYSEELQQRREQNYEAKIALLGKIEEIAAFESSRVQDWINKNQELGQWIENWRSIGAAPAAKGPELKERFVAAIRLFNKKKNEFFRLRKKEKVDNLRHKTELVERAEELVKVDNPAAHKKEVIRLQDEWKKAGPVPSKYSDKIWKRFQAACDAFFARLHQEHSSMQNEQTENLKKKNEVIAKIEDLLKQETIDEPEAKIKEFQNEWNNIGYVPFKEKDKVRKHFFTVLNQLLEKAGHGRGAHSSSEMGYRLMLQNWAGEAGGDKRLDQEIRKHLRDAKRIESEIATLENNMEFFRSSKNADQLRSNLENQISHLRNKLTELYDKIQIVRSIGS